MLRPYRTAQIDFNILREIGAAGANSRTFVSHDQQLNAEVVVKQIEKSRLHSQDEFFAEAQALHSTAHPNVVSIQYACFDDDNIYVVMPYYRKGSLQDKMNAGFLTVRQIVRIAVQISAGLHNIHSKGLIHFDIKPNNILLSQRDEALIADFGLAKQMNFAGRAVQDRHYGKMVPPEALLSDQLGRTFDIYQLGLTLYRMCNGNSDFCSQLAQYGVGAAFRRDDFKFDVRNGRFPDRSSFLPHIPSRLRSIISKCLSINPVDRFQSANEVANELAAIDGNCLDWQYVPNGQDRIWTKQDDQTIHRLVLDLNGKSYMTKSINGAAARRVAAGCCGSIGTRELKKLFTDY